MLPRVATTRRDDMIISGISFNLNNFHLHAWKAGDPWLEIRRWKVFSFLDLSYNFGKMQAQLPRNNYLGSPLVLSILTLLLIAVSTRHFYRKFCLR